MICAWQVTLTFAPAPVVPRAVGRGPGGAWWPDRDIGWPSVRPASSRVVRGCGLAGRDAGAGAPPALAIPAADLCRQTATVVAGARLGAPERGGAGGPVPRPVVAVARRRYSRGVLDDPGQRPGPLEVRVSRYGLHRGDGFGRHAHAEPQIVWARGGVVHVLLDDARVTLARHQAVWLPGGVAHDVVAASDAVLYCGYLAPRRCPEALIGRGATVVAATPLVRELLVLLDGTDLDDAARAPAEALLLAVLRPLDQLPVSVPTLRDDRLARIGRALAADPSDGRSLEAWSRVAGAGTRTLARLFVRDTGMTFATWRTHLRVAAASALLADGLPVGVVAGRVGYASPSAFVAAFRTTTGRTPASLYAESRDD